MSRKTIWQNKDGLSVGFGTRKVETVAPAKVRAGKGTLHTMVLGPVDLATLPTAASSYTSGQFSNAAQIPANAFVTEVRIFNVGAVTAGSFTALTLGTYTINQTTGALTAVVADGLVDATAGAVAGFNAAGESVTVGKAAAAGVTGKTTVGSNPVYAIPLAVGASATAGSVRIEIDYSV